MPPTTVRTAQRRYEISHHGVPIGRVSLTTGELGVGDLEPYSGYAGVRDLIRAASRSLWAVGFLASGASVDTVRRTPLDIVGQAADLELDLYDEKGTFVPTDFVNIVERQDETLVPAVFVRFRLERAGTAAVAPPSTSPDSQHRT